MSPIRIPDDIEGLGKSGDRLRQNPDFDPSNHSFDTDSYFVWSRIDGVTTLRDVILMVAMDIDRTIEILRDLRERGALLRPGENAASMLERVAAAEQHNSAARRVASGPASRTSPGVPQASMSSSPGIKVASAAGVVMTGTKEIDSGPIKAPQWNEEVVVRTLTEEETAAMAAEVKLDEDAKLRILAMRRKIHLVDYFTLLEVTPEDDKRSLKRAYFRLSKEFHPDRYYGRDMGPFAGWLAEIFETVNRSFEVLSDDKARAQYLEAIKGGATPARIGAQTQSEYAQELFDRACHNENQGDLSMAMKLFAAATRLDPQPRYFSRAARCALAAGRLREGEKYANKAVELDPENPSLLRVLAEVYRGFGKLRQAASTLERALAIKSENDVLAKELAADLAEVRARIAAEGG